MSKFYVFENIIYQKFYVFKNIIYQKYEPTQSSIYSFVCYQFALYFYVGSIGEESTEDMEEENNFDLLQLIIPKIIRILLAFHIFLPTVKYGHHQFYLNIYAPKYEEEKSCNPILFTDSDTMDKKGMSLLF